MNGPHYVELVGTWNGQCRLRASEQRKLWLFGRKEGNGSRADFHFKDLPESDVALRTTGKRERYVAPLVQLDEDYDRTLFALHNKSTRVAARVSRATQRKLKVEQDEHEAQRSWRRTINVIKLADTKIELKAIEAATCWHDTLRSIKAQEIIEKNELVARLNARVIIRK